MELDFILKIAAIGLIVGVLHQVLVKNGRDEYAQLTALAGLVVVALLLLPRLVDLLREVQTVFGF
ncbi:MAG: stage III sporulation protein AC [Oscillospiraceae bacterium]|jgi:stage III sporulation protein AC|nr:stage III sporulation protein AC [Oscillospiraceae bacterium]